LQTDFRVMSFPNEEKEQPVGPDVEDTKKDDLVFHSLIASGEKITPRNPWATVASLIFQLLLLTAVVVVPLFHIDPLPKRKTVTMLYLPPPPVAGAKATKFQAPPKPRSTHTATSTAIPTPVRTTPEAAPPAFGVTGEVIGGVRGGVVGGVPGGVLTEVPAGPRSMPEPTPVKRIRIASRVAEANLIHAVPPQYPPEAGRERIEGTVVLLAVIGSDGSVQDVQVVSGVPILAQAAIEAVKQWQYKPYLLNGVPVEIDSRITVNFTMSRG
jgi:protein TonB